MAREFPVYLRNKYDHAWVAGFRDEDDATRCLGTCLAGDYELVRYCQCGAEMTTPVTLHAHGRESQQFCSVGCSALAALVRMSATA